MAYPFNNAVAMSHMLLRPYVPKAAVLADMTCGNGHDTVFLAELMADTAVLHAFDIQESAVVRTKQRLKMHGLDHKNIVCRVGSHDELASQITSPISIVMFNLGYLPSGDHAIHTKSETTIKAIKICLNKIAINGIIMIAAYPGTDAGAEEEAALCQYLGQVPQTEYDVSSWRPVNQVHRPPVLYIIQKRG